MEEKFYTTDGILWADRRGKHQLRPDRKEKQKLRSRRRRKLELRSQERWKELFENLRSNRVDQLNGESEIIEEMQRRMRDSYDESRRRQKERKWIRESMADDEGPAPKVEDATEEELWNWFCEESGYGMFEMCPEDRAELPLLRQYLIDQRDGEGFEFIRYQPSIGLHSGSVCKVLFSRELDPDGYECYMSLARLATKKFNKLKPHTAYKVEQVLNVNQTLGMYTNYYITFTAKEEESAVSKTFQAKVAINNVDPDDPEEVDLCRLKP